MWRFIPFYIAVVAAPLLFGGVKPESQAVLGMLLSLGLILTSRIRTTTLDLPRWSKFALLILSIYPVVLLIPLPLGIIQLLSPERARLAIEFPVDGQIPQWLTLSTSPARTMQRLFEIALAAATFVLARRHATLPGAKNRLAIALSVALILLAAADVWSGAQGRQTVLNLWSVSWGKGYGTFANHNHFANWIYIASMFTIGWTLREIFRRDHPPQRSLILLCVGATGFALTMAFLSASRSGAISFILAIGVFVFLLRRRFQRQSFALAASVILLAAITIGLLAAEPILKRLRSESTSNTFALKSQIWAQTFQIAARFPIFGAGPGSFTRVYNHYKSEHGDGTFHHAENDFVELPLEFGFPVALTFFALIVVFASRIKHTDSPPTAGIIAALLLFLAHCTVEFISHIPANLLLAAMLLGTIEPSRVTERPPPSRWVPLILQTILLAVSVFQFGAWYDYWRATHSADRPGLLVMRRSLAMWPFAVDRNVAHLRLISEYLSRLPRDAQLQFGPGINRQTSQALLHLDPLNWNLRLEQSWFQLAYTKDTARAVSNAWLTVRVNPLQGQIPLRFARHFRQSDPELALQFLAAVHPGVPANHREALDLAWTMTGDPSQLWKLTPNTTNAILNLIHFAQQKRLYPIAAQACQALENRVQAVPLARHYLEARRPDQAVRLLENLNSLSAQSLRIQALHAAGRYKEAASAAQTLFASPSLQPIFEQKLRATESFSQLLTNHQTHPTDPVAGVLLAEKIATMTPHNIEILSNLSRNFPTEPRIAYLHFRIQTNNPAIASEIGAGLASRLISP